MRPLRAPAKVLAPALLLLACAAAAREWSFDHGADGWRVGAGPIEEACRSPATAGLDTATWNDGVLVVRGHPVPGLFLDATGYIRRGIACEQWLLSPLLAAPADSVRGLRLRVRGTPGTAVLVRLEWMTDQGLLRVRDHAARQRGVDLPDSVRVVADQYTRGAIAPAAWEAYVTRWEQTDGRRYAGLEGRLEQERIALQEAMRTLPLRVPLTAAWQTVDLPTAAAATAGDQLRYCGIEVRGEPVLADLGLGGTALSEWLLDVDAIALEEGPGPQAAAGAP